MCFLGLFGCIMLAWPAVMNLSLIPYLNFHDRRKSITSVIFHKYKSNHVASLLNTSPYLPVACKGYSTVSCGQDINHSWCWFPENCPIVSSSPNTFPLSFFLTLVMYIMDPIDIVAWFYPTDHNQTL